jgi:acyl carrier protein
VFRVPPETLSPETGVGSIESWDSLTHIELIFRIEEAFSVRFATDRLLGFATLSDIESELERLAPPPSPAD